MSTSFSAGAIAVLPDLVDGFQAERQSRHVFNIVLGSTAEDVVTRPAGPRSGTFTAVFSSLARAQQLLDLCSGTTPIVFADSDVPSLGMTFLADGRIAMEQSAGRSVWIVAVAYREVSL